tara:strand:+ start:135 stop:662 length:528 start_codon:yes stop_codon:yes gene_type:complete
MTGSTYIDFDKATARGLKLIRTGENPNFGLLIICGINLGMRIGDLLTLTFKDLKSGTIILVEQKTKKRRELKVNDNIKSVLNHFNVSDNLYCFRTQKESVISPQHVNRLLKKHFNKDTSSHSLRKTFGRRVWENNNCSEKALTYLSELFNHATIKDTRTYLGIRQEELNDIYDNL